MAVTWNGPEIEARVRAGAMRGISTWLGILDQHWVDLITAGGKTGRLYKRRGVVHQASAPGEPPASDTGTLVRSRVQELIPEQLAGRFKITAGYAMALEVGTRNMAPRPHARRALAETAEQGQAALESEIAQALQ